ncbi:MAG TPA: copper-containing nitrite reductase [Vicinamibacterales bacterium]|nr:copper-containing nitrite reductase [Vicinamibacterales bacterium]
MSIHRVPRTGLWLPALVLAAAAMAAGCSAHAQTESSDNVSYAPQVPPPIDRRSPALIHVELDSTQTDIGIFPGVLYKAWTFNNHVPGPFIRAREGDTLEVTVTNSDPGGMPHNLDFHAVSGPGGGGLVTTVTPGGRTTARFTLLYPGLFVYHCGAAPVMDHLANGMYGLLLVEPKGGLPHADREYYVMQSEFYTTPPTQGSREVQYSHEDGLNETPRYIVFNGGANMMGDGALRADVGETVRIFFGNAGPNKVSSFHVVGAVLEHVYREGDLVSPPARDLQTTLVPPGGATVVDFTPQEPGAYTLLDHAIFRIEKGAVGMLRVGGMARPDIYEGQATPLGQTMSHH